jgi:hypothetical protein
MYSYPFAPQTPDEPTARRRPSWRRRVERAAWHAEGAVIEQKRERLQLLAVDLGLVIGSA